MGPILDAIKKGFGIATKSLGLVLILFVFNLIWNLASIPLARQAALVGPAATPPPQLTAATLIFSLIFILISIFVQGGALGVIRDYIKEGKSRLGAFASYGLKYYVRLFVLGLLIVLVVAIVALIAGLIIAATAPLKNNIVTGLAAAIAMIIGLVAGLLYLLPFTLSPYAIVCDEIGAIEAMKKSLKVAKKPLSKLVMLFLLLVVIILISLGIGLVIGFIVGMITALMPAGAGQILMAIATSAINSYLGVVTIVAFMVFYMGLAKEKVVAEKIL